MAELNTSAAPVANGRRQKEITHYINASIVTKSGQTVRIGSIAVMDGGDKAQRTLIDAVFNQKIDPVTFDVVIDVRSAEKSTELADINDWATRTGGEEQAA